MALNSASRHVLRRASTLRTKCPFSVEASTHASPNRSNFHSRAVQDTAAHFPRLLQRPAIVQNIRRPVVRGLGVGDLRTLFIQTENTPNPDALKFKPNSRVLPEDLQSPFLEYLSARSTIAPPHPSPLAAQLFNVDGVTSIFFGNDYITVTKDSGTNWDHVKPEVFSIITETVSAGTPIVNTIEGQAGEGQEGSQQDSLTYNESDSEVVGMIKELLETRIRPAIQEDGGDIDFRGFKDGWVMLKLRGACRTCDSSTVTLRNGIESMLMHYIEEVKGVQQVLDREEEVAMEEFAKFEEKLRKQKGTDVTGSSPLDKVEAQPK